MEFSHDTANALAHSTEQFPIDFDDAWQWVGYSEKRSALKILQNNFEEGFDFLYKGTKSTGGRSSKWVVLTLDCFKSFCMMAGTEKGKEVRRYYLEIERESKQQNRLHAAEILDRLERIEKAIEMPALPPDLAAQLSSGNPQLCWIFKQCQITLDAGVLTINFPSQELENAFLTEEFIESLSYAADAIGARHCFQRVKGELSVQFGVKESVNFINYRKQIIGGTAA